MLFGVCGAEKWLCRGVEVRDRLGECPECVWLWSWRRNEVVVDLTAHLNEVQTGDDIARQLSWMEKEDGRKREKVVEELEFADNGDNSLLSVLLHDGSRNFSKWNGALT
jgi:hypothetical protein